MAAAPSYAADRALGTASEENHLTTLMSFLGTTLNRTGRFCAFDYEDEGKTVMVELKTRRIRHDAYPTAIINRSKVEFARARPNCRFWFVFCYSDGLFAIQYDQEVFAGLYCDNGFVRGHREGIEDNATAVIHIPHGLLRRVEGV